MGSVLFPSTNHPWRVLALEYTDIASPLSIILPIADDANRRTGRRAPRTSKDWRASSHFLCQSCMVSLGASSRAEESSERRSKQRSASGGFCLADATTDSSCATSAPNRDSGMGSPAAPPRFAMVGRREEEGGGNGRATGSIEI
jgi:hypothetical protein